MADWEIDSTDLICRQSLPVSQGETGELCRECGGLRTADWEIVSTALILSTARFQFRKAKLASFVVNAADWGNWVLQI